MKRKGVTCNVGSMMGTTGNPRRFGVNWKICGHASDGGLEVWLPRVKLASHAFQVHPLTARTRT
jgi:hypothetical protein